MKRFHAAAVLICAFLCFGLAPFPARADPFQVLHAFDHTSGAATPYGSVVDLDGWLYGTTAFSQYASSTPGVDGPMLSTGALFKLRPDGSDYSIVKYFDAVSGCNPFNGLTTSGGKLVGATVRGGDFNAGTLYTVNVDGSGFRVIHSFQASAGSWGVAAPILVGSRLYGMTAGGGSHPAAPEVAGSKAGVLYSCDIVTGDYRVEREFAMPGVDASAIPGTQPYGALIQVGEWLYGTTTDIRSRTSSGIVFRYRPADNAYEVVHSFAGGASGGGPYDKLAWDGGHYLYGTTLGFYPFHPLNAFEVAALADEGVIFRIDLDKSLSDQTHYQVLHDFSAAVGDGAKPNSSMLVGPDGWLYGISHGSVGLGGPWNGVQYGTEFGTLYRLRPDGTEFSVLHTFDSLAAGLTPMRGLVWKDGTIYGTTAQGGDGPLGADPYTSPGNGTVWSFTVYPVPEPSTSVALIGAAVVAGVSRFLRLARSDRTLRPGSGIHA